MIKLLSITCETCGEESPFTHNPSDCIKALAERIRKLEELLDTVEVEFEESPSADDDETDETDETEEIITENGKKGGFPLVKESERNETRSE